MTTRAVSLKITADVQGLQSRLRKAGNDVAVFGKAASRSIQKNRAEWAQLSTGLGIVGAGMVGLAAVAVRSFAQFDRSMSKVKASGADAAANIGALRDAAVRAGADTQYSAAEAADAITDLAKAGVSAKDILGGGLAGALSLAAAGEMEVKDAAEVTAIALAQFQLKGDQASHVADLLAAGAGKAMGEVYDLGMALRQSGLVASQVGLNLEETTGALAAFAQKGLIGSDAGTSLKTMLQRLNPQSAEAAKQFEELHLSAYDANGEFVGLSKFAGQLRTSMTRLSPQARAAAMSVMFGSDAVRAANVLYEEGADGIETWIHSVTDAGFAARQAATLTDNLSGDLERLGGAVDTALIQSGSGLNGMLRGLVQGTERAVDAIGGLPEPALQGAARFVVLAGGAALVTAGLVKGVSAYAEYRESMSAITKQSPKMGRALESTARAAKVAAVAFAALQVVAAVGGTMQANVDKTHGSLADMAEAAANAAGGSGLGALDAQFQKVQSRFFVWETGAAQVKSVGDAISQTVRDTQGFNGFMAGTAAWVASLVGQKTSLVETQEQLAKLDQSLAGMDATKAASTFSQVAESAALQGVAVEDLLVQFPEYKATLQGAAGQLGVTNLAAQDYADWMGGKVPQAVEAAIDAHPALIDGLSDTQRATLGSSEALQRATRSTVTYGDTLSGVQPTLKEAAQAQEDYLKKLFDTTDAYLSLSGAMIGYEAMLDDNAKATRKLVKETKNKKNLQDVDTKAGRAALEILNDTISKTATRAKQMAEQHKSQKSINRVMNEGRQALVDQARAMGWSEKKIARLIDEADLVPESLDINLNTTGVDAAYTQLSTLKEAMAGLPKKTQTKVLSAFNDDGVRGAYDALADIDGETADAWVKSLLARGGIVSWENYRPKDKNAWINVHQRTGSGSNRATADGAIYSSVQGQLLKAFASGGLASIGVQQPQIAANRGPAGIQWAETGAGPWEAFISGHPGKRARSLAIWTQVGERLGAFADGGFAMPGLGALQLASGGSSTSTVTHGPTVNVTNVYPQAEPASVTTNRALQTAAAIGRFS